MSFGEEVARACRDFRRGDEVSAVAFLAPLAGPGPALELAIGTGRIALPLAARGIRVDGIDISPAMVDQLRAQPGGDQISVRVPSGRGDFADVPVTGAYRLIFVVWNTFFNLLTQEEPGTRLRVDAASRMSPPISPARARSSSRRTSRPSARLRLRPLSQWPSPSITSRLLAYGGCRCGRVMRISWASRTGQFETASWMRAANAIEARHPSQASSFSRIA